MATIGPIKEALENDLQKYEAGELDNFEFLVYAKDIGMVASHNWINKFPDWQDKWNKFMKGQTVCVPGVYVCDVYRFLRILERDAQQTEQNEG